MSNEWYDLNIWQSVATIVNALITGFFILRAGKSISNIVVHSDSFLGEKVQKDVTTINNTGDGDLYYMSQEPKKIKSKGRI